MTMILPINRTACIRELFRSIEPNETGTLEIINASFIADEPAIFGTPNENWHKRELEWYHSMSRNVNDIPPPIPKIWKDVAGTDGSINSNYGWCIFSPWNGSQYKHCREALLDNPATRQAVMIYTRPSMHDEAVEKGRRDFMCTNTVQAFIRHRNEHVRELIYIINMRSSDAVFGYKGDYAWHSHIHRKLLGDLHQYEGFEHITRGPMIWNAGSLHIYERHFHLVHGGRDDA